MNFFTSLGGIILSICIWVFTWKFIDIFVNPFRDRVPLYLYALTLIGLIFLFAFLLYVFYGEDKFF